MGNGARWRNWGAHAHKITGFSVPVQGQGAQVRGPGNGEGVRGKEGKIAGGGVIAPTKPNRQGGASTRIQRYIGFCRPMPCLLLAFIFPILHFAGGLRGQKMEWSGPSSVSMCMMKHWAQGVSQHHGLLMALESSSVSSESCSQTTGILVEPMLWCCHALRCMGIWHSER